MVAWETHCCSLHARGRDAGECHAQLQGVVIVQPRCTAPSRRYPPRHRVLHHTARTDLAWCFSQTALGHTHSVLARILTDSMARVFGKIPRGLHRRLGRPTFLGSMSSSIPNLQIECSYTRLYQEIPKPEINDFSTNRHTRVQLTVTRSNRRRRAWG